MGRKKLEYSACKTEAASLHGRLLTGKVWQVAVASSSNYDDDDGNKNIRKATGLIRKKKRSERSADFLADFSAVTVHWLTMLNLNGMEMRSSLYFKSLRSKIIATLISSIVPLDRESPNTCVRNNIAAPYWTG